jgi:hypothetical protein
MNVQVPQPTRVDVKGSSTTDRDVPTPNGLPMSVEQTACRPVYTSDYSQSARNRLIVTINRRLARERNVA